MNQPFYVQTFQGHKNPEMGHTCDAAAKDLANMLLGKVTLQPSHHIICGIISPALTGRKHCTELLPHRLLVLFSGHAFRIEIQLDLGYIALGLQDGMNHAVREQIRITSDRCSKMGITLVGQPKMPTIDWTVNGLLH